MLAATYFVAQSVEIPHPKPGRLGSRQGGRDRYICEQCSDADKRDRGGCPYLADPGVGEPAIIDSTGDESHDVIYVCPRGVALSSPGAAATWLDYATIEAAGGPGAWYGAGIVTLPHRVGEALRVCRGVQERFAALLRQTQREMQK